MRVTATAGAEAAVRTVAASGREDLVMVLGTGCCDSTAPFLYDHYYPGPDAVRVGEVAGVPVLAPAWLSKLYRDEDSLMVDVDNGILADSFSLETEHGCRFTLRVPARPRPTPDPPDPSDPRKSTPPDPRKSTPPDKPPLDLPRTRDRGGMPPLEEGTVAQGSQRRITLVICDDHRLLTDSLAMVLKGEPDNQLVNEPEADPALAVELVRARRPDVVLMDIGFTTSRMNGFEATRRIKEASPATNVIIMTASGDEAALVASVEAGAAGFITKTEAVEQVLAAVRAAAEGEVLIDPRLLSRALQLVARDREARREADTLLDQLTERELEVLRLLAQGERNDDIAHQLFISQQTVQTHVRNILSKLRVHSKLEAVTFAVRHGAVEI
jgi:DNA-binding NarL/FixJ family response regulator/uncharacterized protein (DUF779 family)